MLPIEFSKTYKKYPKNGWISLKFYSTPIIAPRTLKRMQKIKIQTIRKIRKGITSLMHTMTSSAS